MREECCPPPKSKRAVRAEARKGAVEHKEPSDALGVMGLFGTVALMGLCCGILPLVLAGVITVGGLAAGLPWLGAVLALVVVAWWVARRVRRARRKEAEGNAPSGGAS